MTAKIIPFRIIVNPRPHSDLMHLAYHNADMDYDTIPAKALAALAKEQGWLDCFHSNGQLNARKLAEKLTDEAKQRGATKVVHQSTIHRIQSGVLKGKPDTLKPIALGFGMSVNDLYARIHPETAAPPAESLPAAAAELWADFHELPKGMQEYYKQAIRASKEQVKRFPHLAALANPEAMRAAEEVRAQRVRSRRQRAESDK